VGSQVSLVPIGAFQAAHAIDLPPTAFAFRAVACRCRAGRIPAPAHPRRDPPRYAKRSHPCSLESRCARHELDLANVPTAMYRRGNTAAAAVTSAKLPSATTSAIATGANAGFRWARRS
jgi:hypothetical protein